MKKLIIASLLSATAFGATTTANPFKLSFYLMEKDAEVTAILKQSCRYEKFVFSDSSEYEARWQEFPLQIKTTKVSGGKEVEISLKSQKTMSVTGIFKPTKGCYSNVEVSISSTKYSIGWANRFDKAISFELRTKQFYKEDNSELNLSPLLDKLENKELSFYMKKFSSQVNTFLYFDGERDWDVFAVTAAKDPKTNLPYPLKK
ncbi:hypothetical protein [Bacteriovorax sp. DB6_IX]|uniref:hypothetical protein n=1 Tax=Bacteriovorax sp. DB6_IX TaxID=1353530 RepID=UPI000389E479|nr:hypothetical protein [Bacteriovorax sp. DB6_IX]EQC52066.1 hypothetical protein M901_1358 [Bacteriovorax sp. DB6_IX]